MDLEIHLVGLYVLLIVELYVLKNTLCWPIMYTTLPIPATWDTAVHYHIAEHIFFWTGTKQLIMFTREELIRLHMQFMHPASDRLFTIINRSKP